TCQRKMETQLVPGPQFSSEIRHPRTASGRTNAAVGREGSRPEARSPGGTGGSSWTAVPYAQSEVISAGVRMVSRFFLAKRLPVSSPDENQVRKPSGTG